MKAYLIYDHTRTFTSLINSTDFDECERTPGICGVNAICTDTTGSYDCECGEGYQMVDNLCEGKQLYA